MHQEFVIGAAAFLGSLFTLFSGFGLGTLLLPVFALFFDLPLAIALTAVVHLLNNVVKFLLFYKHVNLVVLTRFGITAVLFSFVGAFFLQLFPNDQINIAYQLGTFTCHLTPLKVVIGLLLLLFALIELLPKLNTWGAPAHLMPLGGVLSGFFGGLSGHQGALRTAFLSKAGLDKNSLIGTGVAIALGIDVVRLAVYKAKYQNLNQENMVILSIAVGAATVGAWCGFLMHKKMTFGFLKVIIGSSMICYAVLLILGVI